MATANWTKGNDALPVAGEIVYKGEEPEHIAMTMQSLLGSSKTTKNTNARLATTTERFVSLGNTTENQNYTWTPELSVNGTDVHFPFTNFSSLYANNSRSPFRTQVSINKAVGCCPIDNLTSINSTDTEQNHSDDALGPVIGGLCTAVGLLLCLWLICFAVEKRIHSRKRAVERHYLPQSRSYPIQVAEMRKALRQHWDTATRNSRRSYPWSSKRSSRQNSISEPNCIVVGRQYGGINTPSITVTSATPEPPSIHPEGEVKVEPTANGFPGAPSIRICRSAPAMSTSSFRANHSPASSASDDDNLSATTSGDVSEESGDNNTECKPIRMFLSVGDPYTYTPGGVFVEEAIAENPVRLAEGRIDGQKTEKRSEGDSGATEERDKEQKSNDSTYLNPQMAGLRNQLEIDESQCLTR